MTHRHLRSPYWPQGPVARALGALSLVVSPAARRRAQVFVAGPPRWKHPYYWAAFRLEGDRN
jgi:CHAT domain-containing protein